MLHVRTARTRLGEPPYRDLLDDLWEMRVRQDCVAERDSLTRDGRRAWEVVGDDDIRVEDTFCDCVESS